MNRSAFIKLSTSAAVGLPLFGLQSCSRKPESVTITILHTNDMHSRIEPFPADDPKYPGGGGMARRAALIKALRKETEHVILLDAGDVFQGTPYFNVFGGSLEFQLMSQMGYDACAIGNHDLDNGVDGLSDMLHHAEFPFVCANYNFDETVLKHRIKPWVVIERGGIRVGVVGLGVELDGLVLPANYGGIVYHDPVKALNEAAQRLRQEEDVDLVIALSHLGFRYDSEKISDCKLAQQTSEVDIIIGGHTHTFLDKPYEAKNKNGENVLIHQVGWAGLRLGRIDVTLTNKGKSRISAASNYTLELPHSERRVIGEKLF